MPAGSSSNVPQTAGKRIDFWFEFASTYSYPAAMRIEELAAAHDISIAWKPFLLGPVSYRQGWNNSPFNLYPAKGRYMWRDLERICLQQGLEFHRPSQFPRNGLLAARIACRFAEEAWLPEFVRRVYTVNFARDEDISDAGVLRSILEGLVDADECLERAQSEEVKVELRARTEGAIELGIFGAPTFVTHGEMFWGNDRLEDAIAWSQAAEAGRTR